MTQLAALLTAYLILCVIGFSIRTSHTERPPRQEMPEIKFRLSRYRFQKEQLGWKIYIPIFWPPLISLWRNVGACYLPKEHKIMMNLPNIKLWEAEPIHDSEFIEAEDLAEKVMFILEHESLHAAIASHQRHWEKAEAEKFREKFREASRTAKLYIFLKQGIYAAYHLTDYGEEKTLARIQGLNPYYSVSLEN